MVDQSRKGKANDQHSVAVSTDFFLFMMSHFSCYKSGRRTGSPTRGSESESHAGNTHCIRTGVFTVSRTRDCEQPREWQRKISPTRNSGGPSRARMVRHENERISRRV